MTSFAALVPVYNNWAYLPQCVESIRHQARPFDEIILVDDASTEPQVISYLKSLAGQRGFKILFCEANGGIVMAQNKGLSICTADYVSFVDCDDVLRPSALEIVASAVKEFEADYYFTDREHIDDNGAAIDLYSVGARILAHRRGLKDLLLDHMVASHLKTVRTAVMAQSGYFESGTDGVQDWDLALKISEIGRMHHIASPVYQHRVHVSQNSTEARIGNFQKTNNVRRSALERRKLTTKKSELEIQRAIEVVTRLVGRLKFRMTELGQTSISASNDACVVLIREKTTSLFAVCEMPEQTLLVGDILVVLCSSRSNLGVLRYAPGFNSATTCLLVFNNQLSIAMAQWFNSYFDIIMPLSVEAQLGLLGVCWDGHVACSTFAKR